MTTIRVAPVEDLDEQGRQQVHAVSEVAIERDVPFFCIPVGTRNHFALDVGRNRDDPLAALSAVDGGQELRIEYGAPATGSSCTTSASASMPWPCTATATARTRSARSPQSSRNWPTI
jgi:hypothetical protein